MTGSKEPSIRDFTRSWKTSINNAKALKTHITNWMHMFDPVTGTEYPTCWILFHTLKTHSYPVTATGWWCGHRLSDWMQYCNRLVWGCQGCLVSLTYSILLLWATNGHRCFTVTLGSQGMRVYFCSRNELLAWIKVVFYFTIDLCNNLSTLEAYIHNYCTPCAIHMVFTHEFIDSFFNHLSHSTSILPSYFIVITMISRASSSHESSWAFIIYYS